jgi:hypothetical protein
MVEIISWHVLCSSIHNYLTLTKIYGYEHSDIYSKIYYYCVQKF